MGRGLSDLQKDILRLALRYQNSVLTFMVLREHWHWPLHKEAAHYEGHWFDPSLISEKPYNTARASLSRAFRRLETRGLVVRQTHGICLTAKGIKIAQAAAQTGRWLSSPPS